MSKKAATILLVEDSLTAVGMITEMLRDAGNLGFSKYFFEVDHRDSIATSVEYLISQKVDLILLDLNLPDSEGLDTFAKIHDHVQNVPIVILTGVEDELLGIKALQMGAQDYWLKSEISRNILIRIINYAMERYQLLNELEIRVEERTQELLVVNQRLQQEALEREQRQEELQKINDHLLKVRLSLEGQVASAKKKKEDLVQKMSELTLSKADLAQNQVELTKRVSSLEAEKETLRDQLVLYYEALQQSNTDIDELLVKIQTLSNKDSEPF